MRHVIYHTFALTCVLGAVDIVSARVVIVGDTSVPALVNPSFEDQGDASDRAAGWGRWGEWFNREETWIPVRNGRCILGYHHWQIPSANDSGVHQDVPNAKKGMDYTFGIFASVDKARPPTHDALSIELRLECVVNGTPQRIASKSYLVADLTPDQWEKLTVSGTPVYDSLRVLVIVRPSPSNRDRGGAIRFDDAFLAPTASAMSLIP